MGKEYSHLSRDERVAIAVLKKEGKSMSEIARAVGRNKGTVSREMKHIFHIYRIAKAVTFLKDRLVLIGSKLSRRIFGDKIMDRITGKARTVKGDD